jgi:hypothetical protein
MHGRNHLVRYISIVALTLCVASCNDDSTTGSGSTTDQSAAGIWTGTDSESGLSLTALVNSSGVADFIRSDGTQFVGTVQVSGTSLAVTLDGYSQFGSSFSDGSTYGLGTLDATVATTSTINGTLSFTTNDNTAITSTWSLNFDSLYNNASSLATVAGAYTDSVTSASVTISGAGVMTGTNTANSCSLSGQISAQNTSYNVYEVSYTYSGCTGADSVLNAVQFTGLAFFNPNVSPTILFMGVTGTSSAGVKYGLVSTLDTN